MVKMYEANKLTNNGWAYSKKVREAIAEKIAYNDFGYYFEATEEDYKVIIINQYNHIAYERIIMEVNGKIIEDTGIGRITAVEKTILADLERISKNRKTYESQFKAVKFHDTCKTHLFFNNLDLGYELYEELNKINEEIFYERMMEGIEAEGTPEAPEIEPMENDGDTYLQGFQFLRFNRDLDEYKEEEYGPADQLPRDQALIEIFEKLSKKELQTATSTTTDGGNIRIYTKRAKTPGLWRMIVLFNGLLVLDSLQPLGYTSWLFDYYTKL